MPSVRYARPGGPPRTVQPAGPLPEKAAGGGASAGTTTALASPSMCRTRRREVRARTRTARRVAPAREKRPGRAPPSRSTAEGNLASLTRLAGTDLPTGIGDTRAPRATERARAGRCRSAPESSARPRPAHPPRPLLSPRPRTLCASPQDVAHKVALGRACARVAGNLRADIVCREPMMNTQSTSSTRPAVCCQAQRTQVYPEARPHRRYGRRQPPWCLVRTAVQ